MKTFRTIVLIAGILIAGIALNTAVGQSVEKPAKENKAVRKEYKGDLKSQTKIHPKANSKVAKHEFKDQRKHKIKSEIKEQKGF